jgi:hypothetical protein
MKEKKKMSEKLLSQDNNKASKTKKDNTKTIYKNGCKIVIEPITNLETKKEFKATACDKEYFCEIIYNSDRQKFQALFTLQGRRQSLSFFPLESLAKENIFLSIALSNGYGNNRSNGVGD